MKALAIVVLIVTIAGAGAVLYGMNTLEPVVEQASVLVTPASQAQDVFENVFAVKDLDSFDISPKSIRQV